MHERAIMKQITEEEFKAIIASHKTWLQCQHTFKEENPDTDRQADFSDTCLQNIDFAKEDLTFANFASADLRGANMAGMRLDFTDFTDANLSDAKLNNAKLSDAKFVDADLSNAQMTHTLLIDANFKGANLTNVDLSEAILHDANMRNANLFHTNLSYADLTGADLRCTKLTHANLYGANLSRANLNRATGIPKIKCPAADEFVGWNITQRHLIKLLIPEDAQRSSGTTNICRCSKAKVLGIFSLRGRKSDLLQVHSNSDGSLIYRIGETVEVLDNNGKSSFDENRWEECSTGILFFMSKKEALNYLNSK